ncbi:MULTISPECIES: SURF1 family protein [unclassified Streptomyces]|uniref:SURF1 family protein n=1 Tax=unclassified Streptomyces TaxID=2593676 RepID=UPI0022B63664|nr:MULTISPECIES: SURF1 family protein [unclassified Streptomyces]MCZ7415219.1 SURF1 family protein [Streptomyces sp. WMMC897]MCZ7432164.1 SURF1 family protein [Streptomyces sp. WMMC1477]
MYRFLLTPRWWMLNVFLVLAVPFCVVMGAWQLSRFEDRVDSQRRHDRLAAQGAAQEAEPLAALLPVTGDTSGRMARVEGRYDTGHEYLVPDRSLDGERGFYVLTPLRPDGGRPAVPVVRGWLPGEPDASRVPPAPAGEVRVTGALQASESRGRTGLPAGQLGVISAASLVNLVPYDVEDAWITVQSTREPLRAVPPAAAKGSGLDMKAFQNLGYTAEWFVFAGFVVFMWFRFFRREVEVARDAELGLIPGTPDRQTPDRQTPGRETREDPGAAVRTAAPDRPA